MQDLVENAQEGQKVFEIQYLIPKETRQAPIKNHKKKGGVRAHLTHVIIQLFIFLYLTHLVFCCRTLGAL